MVQDVLFFAQGAFLILAILFYLRAMFLRSEEGKREIVSFKPLWALKHKYTTGGFRLLVLGGVCLVISAVCWLLQLTTS